MKDVANLESFPFISSDDDDEHTKLSVFSNQKRMWNLHGGKEWFLVTLFLGNGSFASTLLFFSTSLLCPRGFLVPFCVCGHRNEIMKLCANPSTKSNGRSRRRKGKPESEFFILIYERERERTRNHFKEGRRRRKKWFPVLCFFMVKQFLPVLCFAQERAYKSRTKQTLSRIGVNKWLLETYARE